MEKNSIRTAFCAIGALLCIVLIAFCCSPAMISLNELPAVIYYSENVSDALAKITVDEPFTAGLSGNQKYSVAGSNDEASSKNEVSIKLFGLIPVKKITLVEKNEKRYIPSGQCVGVALHTKGVLVVGTSTVITDINGDGITEETESPAKMAGIEAGDIILYINGNEVADTNHLCTLISRYEGMLTVTYERDGSKNTVDISSVYDTKNGDYKLGAWVRDSTAGIGTLSFYSVEDKEYAALGHAITDIDTNTIFDVGEGRIVECEIVDINKGKAGEPGELVGVFSASSRDYGDIQINSDYGMYGRLSAMPETLYPNGMEISSPNEAVVGDATLCCAAEGELIEYKCRIIRLFHQDRIAQKGMVIEICDDRLTEATGGIVQGMSGSPILQNGKIVGVLTHVMVNEPQRGYAMYAFWLAEVLEEVE